MVSASSHLPGDVFGTPSLMKRCTFSIAGALTLASPTRASSSLASASTTYNLSVGMQRLPCSALSRSGGIKFPTRTVSNRRAEVTGRERLDRTGRVPITYPRVARHSTTLWRCGSGRYRGFHSRCTVLGEERNWDKSTEPRETHRAKMTSVVRSKSDRCA